MKRVHLFLSFALLTGCAGLIGVPDLSFDEGGGGHLGPDGSSATDGSTDPTKDGSTTSTDGGPPPVCDESQLATDTHHCGRCGHDCLGGECKAGKCQSVVLQAGLANPDDLAVDNENVYVTTRGDGQVWRIPKSGIGGTVLATGQTEARGVTLDDTKTTLFWSNMSTQGNGTGGDVGGVWKCALPDCATKMSVTTGDWALGVRYYKGTLFFAEDNGFTITKVQPDGSLKKVLDNNTTHPFSLAVDDSHVYYQSFSGITRAPVVPLDGGGGDEVFDSGGVNALSLGFITVDADRVYWAYTTQSGGGLVQSALKGNLTQKTTYGTTNKGSLGVAVDATTLYWTNAGTFDTSSSPAENKRDGEILACPKTGCGDSGPLVVATGLLNTGVITVDGDALYFTNFGTSYGSSDGEVRRIAKP